MSAKFQFLPLKACEVREFLERHHYSRSINGVKVAACFGIFDCGVLVGAALFGALSTTAWKKYGSSEAEVVELRRLVCLDECPRNTESWFIAKCLKWLKVNSFFKICVSYADPFYGHCGVVYQAANWTYRGTTPPDTVLRTPEGKTYHSRALRTKYRGALKPFAEKLVALKAEGLLTEVKVPGKHIYTYALRGRQSATGLKNYPKPVCRGVL